jgi:hypothetical protein
MAILDAYPGLEVQIHVDGQALKEYKSDIDEDPGINPENQCSQYIESATDKEFAIHLSANQNYKWSSPSLKCHIILDGSRMKSATIEPGRESKIIKDVFAAGSYRPFIFSRINTCKLLETLF